MSEDQKNTRAKGRQFRLVKFFAYASFIVLIIFSFPFSVVISQQAKDILMKSYENYAKLLGENLNYQVFQNFVIPVTTGSGKIRLREKQQYDWMDEIVKTTIHGFNIELVNIYDIGKGVIAYSTDARLLGKEVKESLEYKKAVKGEVSSRLLSEGDDSWGFKIESIGGKKKFRTYIPFRGITPFTGEGYVLGVFELIQDLSKEYQSIVKFQYLIFGLSSLIMGLIFIALILIVRKAERIIEERAEEQRELQSQLDQAERLAALGQMLAGVSHEIRNPLGIIRSTAELMGSMPDSKEGQKKLSGVIVEESSRLNNIVTEFLDFAHPMKPNIKDCYLEEIIRKNLHFLDPELSKNNIQVNDNLNGRSFKIKADPQQLYRVFLNIFMNSIQSINGGGVMSVNVEEKRDHYLINIEDTGSGIAEENMKKIFNPFFSTKDKGSGLGLSIVRNIIEAHQGSIRIESKTGDLSKGEASGTKNIIRLPRKK
ncbi:MAG: GHKL domain-containing protein [Deltaproteobacteria bacterium]|nr:GHKL domain-containing protein [Deltaproteobacteria bacterium]